VPGFCFLGSRAALAWSLPAAPVSNFRFDGDVATASITVNTIPKILTAPPGLRTMRDMVLPSYFGGK